MTDKSQVKIKIQTQGNVETLWATPIGQNRYQLDNTPFYAYGISWEDIIEAEPDSGDFLIFKKLVKKSGNRTIRVADTKEKLPTGLIEDIKNLGCSVEGANRKYICINIPPKIRLEKIMDYLTSKGYLWEHADPSYDEYHQQK